MICSNCKTAGKHNTEARVIRQAGLPVRADILEEDAEREHARCFDSCCTCQHVVGDGNLNLDRIQESRRWRDG